MEKTTTLADRTIGQAMWRGTLCRCPHCGQGKMFRAYLKVSDACDVCGEELSHHRADDFPPYIAIMIVGHLLVGVMMHMDMVWRVSAMTYMLSMIPLAIILPLIMLPSIKGAIVGLQWATRMYGFGTGQKD
jgi:uncharacterized protein (DUF983 family)